MELDLFCYAMGVLSFLYFIKISRWKYILYCINVNHSFFTCSLIYFTGLFIGIITPGKVGDFAKIVYLKKAGVSTVKSLLANLIDRIMDILFIMICAVNFLIWLTKYEHIEISISLLFIVIVSTIISFFLFLRYIGFNNIKNRISIFFKRVIGNKWAHIFDKNLAKIFSDLKYYNLSNFLILILLTVVGWLSYIVVIHIFSISLGLRIPFLMTLFFTTFSSIIVLFPISILGVGTRDLTLVLLFPAIGYLAENAVLFSMVILMVYILEAFLGFIAWCIMPNYYK